MKNTLLFFALLVPLALLGLVAYVILSTEDAPPCALCQAVERQDPEGVSSGLAAGAAVDDRAWHAALQQLPTGSDSAKAIVRLLATNGANPNYTWRFSRSTPEGDWAAAIVAERTDDLALIDALIAHGLDVKGQAGAEALVAAAAGAREGVVQRLLAAGVPADARGRWPQRSALAEAIQTRHAGTIAALEAAGATEW